MCYARAFLSWKNGRGEGVSRCIGGKTQGRIAYPDDFGEKKTWPSCVVCGGKSALKASFRKSTSREATPRAGGVRTRPLQNGADDVRFSAQNAHLRAILPSFASRFVRDASKPARFFLRAAAKHRVIHHHPLAAESIHFASKKSRARHSRDATRDSEMVRRRSHPFSSREKRTKTKSDARRLVVRTSSSSSSSLWGDRASGA